MAKESKKPGTTDRLDPRHITLIAKLVGDMDTAFRPTWPKIIKIAEKVTKKEYSRQSLSAHQEIKDAYDLVRSGHAASRKTGRVREPRLPEDEEKDRKIADQATVIQNQDDLIKAYQDLLVRFIGNAILAGVTQERLEADLEPRAEWRSDLDHMAEKTKEARRKQRRGQRASRPANGG